MILNYKLRFFKRLLNDISSTGQADHPSNQAPSMPARPRAADIDRYNAWVIRTW